MRHTFAVVFAVVTAAGCDSPVMPADTPADIAGFVISLESSDRGTFRIDIEITPPTLDDEPRIGAIVTDKTLLVDVQPFTGLRAIGTADIRLGDRIQFWHDQGVFWNGRGLQALATRVEILHP